MPAKYLQIKTICDTRYEPTLTFHDNLFKISDPIRKDFPLWETDGLRIAFNDPDKHLALSIENSRIIIDCDNTSDYKIALESLKKYTTHLLNKLSDIPSFARIGVRKFFVIFPEADLKFEEAATLMSKKLYAQNQDLRNIFSANLNDLAYIIDYEKNGISYHFKSGPMKQSEITKWVPITEKNFKSRREIGDFIRSLPQFFVFVDVDCYQNNIEKDAAHKVQEKLFLECSTTFEAYKNWLF